MKYTSKNTTDYLVRFRNAQKVNEACDGSLITKGVQEHGMKIRFPLHNTGFYSLQEDEKKEAEKEREEMLCAILNLALSDFSRYRIAHSIYSPDFSASLFSSSCRE